MSPPILPPTLSPGRYLVQDVSVTRSFLTTDTSLEDPDPRAKFEPIVVLPGGVLSSIWEVAKNPNPDANGITAGEFTVKVHNMPVIVSHNGMVVAFGSGGLFNDWNIQAHRIGTGEWCWSFGTKPGPEVFYWSVSHNPHDYDEHGHRRVVLKAVPRPTLRELFVLTPLEPETEITTQGAEEKADEA
ncbi:hypothetical protein BDW22DRAFT_1359134 [Trametopsis cervina]|nr:hypothetical protein BDW22DRAFT_1359134 [Trametopsis cervina]